MSVHFTSISPGNPIKDGDVQSLLAAINVEPHPNDLDDFHTLLAAVHDCAEFVDKLPDYQPVSDRFPRHNVHRALPEEQTLGHAWAHRFLINGDAHGGTLAGKTVSVKDNIAVAGVPQLYGTDAFPPWTPTSDATVVTRVLESGATIIGTSTCENLCHSTSSYTNAQGPVDNPYAAGYSAGGSTSGGAALVGAGLVDITLGADQGGSIRVPASLCGCVGLKPTHGLVPYSGISSGDALNDHAGPITRSVYDAALVLDAICGYDGMDDRSLGAPMPGSTTFAANLNTSTSSLQGFKIGLLVEGFDRPGMQGSVCKSIREAAERYRMLGAVVEDVSVPDHLLGPYIWTIQQRVAGCMNLLGTAHGRQGLQPTGLEVARLPWTSDSFQKCFPSTQNVIINGLYLSTRFPGLYYKTVNIARRLRDSFEAVFARYDVLITPTTPTVAPPHSERSTPLESLRPSMGMTINTAIFNITGQPAISIPVGFERSSADEAVRLPVGMQIISGLGKDEKVLRAAHAWESNFDWRAEGSAGHEQGPLSLL
ncbi:amidase signature domain-containing protein [Aspergillus pseudoustus]|uniref:Amidase signature domain-containing protein n=1 Tax=Aspergillus pseudoustus TaxID=1810923 RepID=A0ABR4JCB1_9EURO